MRRSTSRSRGLPTPLPARDAALLAPPDHGEVAFIAQGVVHAVAPTSGLTPLQQVLIAAQFKAMTGHEVDVPTSAVMTPEAFAHGLERRDAAFRTRVLQVMLLCALTLRPMPAEVGERLRAYAVELCVSDAVLDEAQKLRDDSLGLAAVDFDRNGYAGSMTPDVCASLGVTSQLDDAWGLAVDDASLAARWQALGELPHGTLGRRVHEFYRARGFVFPGAPGSAPPLLAQHDWVHVLADYGTTVECELEVFGLIARANDDPRGFSLLAMVISLFETGALASAAGLFEAAPGHLSLEGMAVRLADAMRRGALVRGSVDFLGEDWFAHADEPVDVARRRFGLADKGAAALTAGSVGPWQPGGISAFQAAAGRAAAADADGLYLDHGAIPIAGEQTARSAPHPDGGAP
jgi:hypothetical protein